jgi:hypothetical protein
MINWTRRITAEGVVFYPPEGRQRAFMRVRERVTPLRTLREIRAEQLARMSQEGTARLGEVKRITTAEGEHGVVYSVYLEDPPSTAEIVVGLAFGPDFYTCIEGLVAAPELADLMRHTVEYVVRTMPLGLGDVRQRRYCYSTPDGWQPVVKPHSVSWYPRDFPKHRAVIRVFDAVPAKVTPSIVLQRRLFSDPQNDLSSISDATLFECLTDRGLAGGYEVQRGTWVDGVPSAMVRVSLHDTHYSYTLRLEASEPFIDASRTLFDAIVRSIEPVPLPPVVTNESDQLIHWAE